MKLKLPDIEIDLPSDLLLVERQALVDKILNDYSEYFKYGKSEEWNRVVEVRLDVLGTYLLNTIANIRTVVNSQYKDKYRSKRKHDSYNDDKEYVA